MNLDIKVYTYRLILHNKLKLLKMKIICYHIYIKPIERSDRVNKKLICKIIVDMLMLAAMPILMSYMLAGEKMHEWIGVGILILFIVHHILNLSWVKNIFHGKYTISRTVKTTVNILILLMIIGLAYSGITLSRYVFYDLPFSRNYALARNLHMFCSYWGFVLISLHFGFHWDMFLGISRKLIKKKSVAVSIMLKMIAVGIAGYGIYAFVKRDIGSYMLMKIHFAFFDTSESIYMFLLDYLAVTGLFTVIGYYIIYILKVIDKKRRSISK